MLNTPTWKKVMKEESTTKSKAYVKTINALHSKPMENITLNLE